MKLVAVNAKGYRLGEDHQHAKLTNREVDQLLELHEQGWGYKRLARVFEVSKATVRRICSGARRCQTPTDWRGVPVSRAE